MKYTLILNKDKFVVSKSICYIDNIGENNIEITEEQYNQINDFPLKITTNNNKVVSWEKTTLPIEEYVEPVKIPTIEERLAMAEDTINFLLGL